jgi:hypothetical protein
MDVSPEQIERSRRTIQAARVFADNSEAILAHVNLLPEDHVVVAVVTEDHVFAGVHHVSRLDLVERVPELEGPNGWSMLFSPGADQAHVTARTDEMISIADKRIEMMSRIAGRRKT